MDTAPQNAADVSLVIEKINAVMAQGDQNSGMAFGKPVAEWTEIFNTAAQTLKMPVISLAPLKGGTDKDVWDNLKELGRAFKQAADQPTIILFDTTGNTNLKDPDTNWRISNYIESLTVRFPKAIYVQIVPEATSTGPLNLYSMNPKQPRDPSRPIYPV